MQMFGAMFFDYYINCNINMSITTKVDSTYLSYQQTTHNVYVIVSYCLSYIVVFFVFFFVFFFFFLYNCDVDIEKDVPLDNSQ